MTDEIAALGLVDESEIELDRAALAIAALDHPRVELAGYLELLDEMTARLRSRAPEPVTAAAQAAALADVIGVDFGFEGDRETYDEPANADLVRVIDRRRGLPVALAILYVALGRRLGWSVHALNTPAHVLVAVGADRPAVIDPFGRGRRVRLQEVALLLRGADGSGAAEQVGALSNRAVLVRLLMNQASRAEQAGDNARALVVLSRITLIAPGYSFAWWDRARLERAAGDEAAARISLVAMLETTRDPKLRSQVETLLRTLGG